MAERPRPLIYREWWVLLFVIAIAVFPWFVAASTIGDSADRATGWSLFAGAFVAALGLTSAYSLRLHREGRLLPRTKADAEENRARTMRARSYWPVWVAIAIGMQFAPSWLQLVGLGLLSGVMIPFSVGLFLNGIRMPPTD